MFRRWIQAIVLASMRRSGLVTLASIIAIVLLWGYARNLERRTDLLDLLPHDSPSFQNYVRTLERAPGGASFTVVVESPDRAANEKFIDLLSAKLDDIMAPTETCKTACKDEACRNACPQSFIAYYENGTKEVKTFGNKYRWLYASVDELKEADETIDHQIAIRSGLVPDLLGDSPPPTPVATSDGGAPVASSAGDAGATQSEKKAALGVGDLTKKGEEKSKKYDDFPTGYFASDNGQNMVVRMMLNASGTGGASGDSAMDRVTKIVSDIDLKQLHPEMRYGFGGDIPNAIAEKESILSDAVWANVVAFIFILSGIVVYYRSAWALAIVGLPAFLGVGAGYAFAMAYFGYANLPGLFLGAIILGNGINYPIVLLSRYKEFRARGMDAEPAMVDAVMNAFRAELVGASVASIAYGSLTITQFRGFSQFGAIGFVGMFAVWVAIVPMVPALVSFFDRVQTKLPSFLRWLRDPPPMVRTDGTRGPFIRAVAWATERGSIFFVLFGIGITAYAVRTLPAFLLDPWEYSFHNLGSKSAPKAGGAGEWTTKGDRVFQGKMDISGARVFADSMEQVPILKAQILANDAADKVGSVVEDIITIDAFLPGTLDEQKEKLKWLDSIRDRLAPSVIDSLPEDEQKKVNESRPPDDLRAISGLDLPPLLKRRFTESNGTVGTMMYLKYRMGLSIGDGRNALRIAATTDNVKLNDGTVVNTASRATVYAEIIRSLKRDGPLATAASFFAVTLVVIAATRSLRGAFTVLLSLLMGVGCTLGYSALRGEHLNFLNFVALPITFGIGCEYPFNIFDRTRILKGDVTAAVKRSGGAVALCSYTTTIGYGSLMLSDQQALASFGRLAALGEVACFAMALLFLPSLLHLLQRIFPWPTSDDAPKTEVGVPDLPRAS